MVVASAQADLLIVARDGDRERLGPRSLGKTIRFVVDHAACPVQLVWPGSAPDVATIPPPHHPSPVLDAVGHDLAAGLLASVAMASCRSARRSGGTLHDIVTRADHAIARQFGEPVRHRAVV